MEPAFEHDPLTEAVIGCVFHVANGLGVGFLEKVYENALTIALRKAGLEVQQQVHVVVHFEGQNVGDYIGDIVVEGRLLLELKACKALEDNH
ncbi:MAG: GxxExxY protein, partial [Geothrix sp.]